MKKYSRVYIEITNICNRSCSFCPGTSRAPRRMTMDELSVILEKLSGVTEYIYFHVMGEPLTHPDLPEMIRYATSLGFKCAITTNGTLLSRRTGELIDSGVYKVNISVHSFEQGSDSDYYGYLKSISDFAKEASDAGVLTVLRLWNNGHDGGRNDKTLDFFKNELPYEWEWGERGARIRHKLHLEYGDRFDWPDTEAPNMGDRVFCYGLRDHFAILSNGTVIPCCLDREGVISLGNIFKEDLIEILNSERVLAMVSGFSERRATEDLCRRCGYARRFG